MISRYRTVLSHLHRRWRRTGWLGQAGFERQRGMAALEISSHPPTPNFLWQKLLASAGRLGPSRKRQGPVRRLVVLVAIRIVFASSTVFASSAEPRWLRAGQWPKKRTNSTIIVPSSFLRARWRSRTADRCAAARRQHMAGMSNQRPCDSIEAKLESLWRFPGD